MNDQRLERGRDMLFTHKTFIGIDLTTGKRPLTFVALDDLGDQVAIGRGSADQVLAFAAGQESAIVAVNGPRKPNQGLMAQEEFRQSLKPVPKPGRWDRWRVVEYQLRMHGLKARRTPADPSNAPGWIRRGYSLFKQLEKQGFRSYDPDSNQETPPRHISLEVYPHAVFSALLERRPFPKNTLEGRIQRQMVLYINDVDVPNPMRIFEEFTRHRLLQGILPDEGLHTTQELDALAGAFTAWRLSQAPDQVTMLGHPEEGFVAIPVPTLLAKYA
jgi:predicted RNase H-like nuclease